jgi:sigma-E factor negative regulatory protein RseC
MADVGTIVHKGIVKDITDQVIKVEIIAQSACVSCKAQAICGVDTQEKIIEIREWNSVYHVGESVQVLLQESLGLKALFLAYLVPFLILVSVLLVLLQITGKEGLSALVGIGVLVPYFGILYFFRNQLQKTFSFNIAKNDNYI